MRALASTCAVLLVTAACGSGAPASGDLDHDSGSGGGDAIGADGTPGQGRDGAVDGIDSGSSDAITSSDGATADAPIGDAPAVETPASGAFVHPGVLVNGAQLAFVKAKIAPGAEPWTSALAAA